MASLNFQQLWDNHPYPAKPCSADYFSNQCAIRMGVAMAGAGANLAGFGGAKCYPSLKHSPRHVLRAEELSNWLLTQKGLVGPVSKRKNVVSNDFAGKKGIVFVKDGWGAGDHIDLWNGLSLKAGQLDYFALGKEVWFWDLS